MGRINTVKVTTLPKVIYRFGVIPIKIPFFSTEIEENILKFVGKHKRPQIAKTIMREKNRGGGIMLPDVLVQSCNDQNGMGLAQTQTHRSISVTEINPCLYGQLINDKGSKNT